MPPHLTVFSWALKMILKFDDDEDEDDGSDGDGNDADKDDDDEDGLVPRQQRSLESGQRANFSFSVFVDCTSIVESGGTSACSITEP